MARVLPYQQAMLPTLRCVRSVLLLFLAASLLSAGEFAATVVSVADGDTLTVLHDDRKVRVRLFGIDCPEKGQPFGTEARRFTTGLALGKEVTVIEKDIDRYGRIVATMVLADGRNLNNEIVATGWAWWYKRYAPGDEVLQRLEAQARKDRRGLWAETASVPPWEWRKQVPPRADKHRSQSRSQRRDTQVR